MFQMLGVFAEFERAMIRAIGTVSNVASRLRDEAKPGQILIRRPLAAYNVVAAVRAIANCGWSRYAGPYRLSRGTAPHEREYPRRKDSF
jgi:class 3 adenylate cyclase